MNVFLRNWVGTSCFCPALYPYRPCSLPERWICYVSNQLFAVISSLQSPVGAAAFVQLKPVDLQDSFRLLLVSSRDRVSYYHYAISFVLQDLFYAMPSLSFRTGELWAPKTRRGRQLGVHTCTKRSEGISNCLKFRSAWALLDLQKNLLFITTYLFSWFVLSLSSRFLQEAIVHALSQVVSGGTYPASLWSLLLSVRRKTSLLWV